MIEKTVEKLEIKESFRSLITPLTKTEYKQLERKILRTRKCEPIVTWQGFILEGYERYEICKKHQLPYHIDKKEFDTSHGAISWICHNQLEQENITDETRKYLIGVQYEAEKQIRKKQRCDRAIKRIQQLGGNGEDQTNELRYKGNKRQKTIRMVAEENHISHSTVEKYLAYSRAVEEINSKVPGSMARILSGKYKMSHATVLELAKKTGCQITEFWRKMDEVQEPYVKYRNTRKELPRLKIEEKLSEGGIPSVKDMPVYDPDVEVIGLSLTIPSWMCSIEHIRNQTDLREVSKDARDQLQDVLLKLSQRVIEMLSLLGGMNG